MVEGFKMTALPIRRNLKISVYLPDDYNSSDCNYKTLICLDGQDIFAFLNEKERLFSAKNIIDKEEKKFICIGIHSPTIPEWRISEFNPYYNGKVDIIDKTLAKPFFNFLCGDAITLLKQKYRIDDLYILGYKEASIAALSILFDYNIFKGAYLISPKLNDCNIEEMLNDMENNFDKGKALYLYEGGKEISDYDLNSFMSIYKKADNLKTEKIYLNYYNDLGNEKEDYEKEFSKVIKNLLEETGK